MFAVVFPQKESKSMTYIQFIFIYVEQFQRGLGTEIYKITHFYFRLDVNTLPGFN